jgi:hypothetical protein
MSDYKSTFKLNFSGSSLFSMDKMIFNSRSHGFYENIMRIATQNNEEPFSIFGLGIF